MKKILVVFNEDRNIDTYPYILNLLTPLSADCKIDFLVTPEMYSEHDIDNLNLIKQKGPDYAKFAISYTKKHGKSYDLVLAFSIEGLWAVFFHNLFPFRKKINCVYFSMELYDVKKSKPKVIKFLWKYFNCLLRLNLKFSVIQDETRADVLKKQFKFVDKVSLIPNSYIGFTDEKSDFAYKYFGIDENKKILLFTGGLEEWGFDIDLPKNLAPLLEQGYVLLLSGSSRDGYVEFIKSKYADFIVKKQLIISEKSFNEEDYTELVKSAYIGLAWYKALDLTNLSSSPIIQNLYYMGWSSGKLCKYLACGLPVVVPEFYYGYKEKIEDNKVGKVSPYGENIVEKIIAIGSDYESYRKNVKSFYTENLEYSKQAKVVIDEIKSILS